MKVWNEQSLTRTYLAHGCLLWEPVEDYWTHIWLVEEMLNYIPLRERRETKCKHFCEWRHSTFIDGVTSISSSPKRSAVSTKSIVSFIHPSIHASVHPSWSWFHPIDRIDWYRLPFPTPKAWAVNCSTHMFTCFRFYVICYFCYVYW